MKIFWIFIKSVVSVVIGWFIWFGINQYGPQWTCPVDYQNVNGAIPQHNLIRYSIGLPIPTGCNPGFYSMAIEALDFIIWAVAAYFFIGLVAKLFKRK